MNEDIINNLGLIYKVIKDLHCNTKDDEDFDEIFFYGLMGLMKGLENYDSNKSKSKYLYLCIKSSILYLFQKRTNPRRYPPYRPISLDKEYLGELTLKEIIPDKYNIEEEIIKKDRLSKIYNALNNIKNKRKIEIFSKYYGIGYYERNMREIAKEYGISHQRVQQIVQGVLKKLRKELKNDIEK